MLFGYRFDYIFCRQLVEVEVEVEVEVFARDFVRDGNVDVSSVGGNGGNVRDGGAVRPTVCDTD